MVFVDLEKAFDRVPQKVVWWALKYLGVDERIVSVIKAMYEVYMIHMHMYCIHMQCMHRRK